MISHKKAVSLFALLVLMFLISGCGSSNSATKILIHDITLEDYQYFKDKLKKELIARNYNCNKPKYNNPEVLNRRNLVRFLCSSGGGVNNVRMIWIEKIDNKIKIQANGGGVIILRAYL